MSEIPAGKNNNPPFTDAISLWHNADANTITELRVMGKTLSIYIRLEIPSGKCEFPFFGKYDENGNPVFRLFLSDTGSGAELAFELTTDWNEQPLLLSVPVSIIGGDSWHDVIIRYSGPKLDLFVDGVLVEEEWPIGPIKQNDGGVFLIGAELRDGEIIPFSINYSALFDKRTSKIPLTPLSRGNSNAQLFMENGIKSGFQDMIDHLAIWDRPLTNDEIIVLSGGHQKRERREMEILGAELPVQQFWKPRGHNVNAGDCMPFFHDGRFHLFYLFDRRHHRSKWGLGAHQWAHASTTDLIHWEHHLMAVPITEEWEGSICTGSAFFNDGKYYCFYATRMYDRSPARLTAAISEDGIHFEKGQALATLSSPYVPGPARDPKVFKDDKTGLFHILVTTELENPPVASHGGCLAHLVSGDLKHWEQKEPFIVPGYTGQPECPDHFFWNRWYYLIFSNSGVARYRMSREPFGPWIRPKVDVFDGPNASVLKTAAFTGDRRIGAAFLGKGGWGGNVVFREIIQHDDGTLGTKFPDELIPHSGDKLKLKIEALTDGISGDGSHIRIRALEGFGVAALSNITKNIRVRLEVNPGSGSSYFGLCLRGSGNYRQGHELRFEPYRQKVGLRKPDSNSIEENERSAIYSVEGLDRPFMLDIVAKGDIIDVCVDNRRTLVNRVADLDGDRLFFFVQNGDVTFDSIEVRPLL